MLKNLNYFIWYPLHYQTRTYSALVLLLGKNYLFYDLIYQNNSSILILANKRLNIFNGYDSG